MVVGVAAPASVNTCTVGVMLGSQFDVVQVEYVESVSNHFIYILSCYIGLYSQMGVVCW